MEHPLSRNESATRRSASVTRRAPTPSRSRRVLARFPLLPLATLLPIVLGVLAAAPEPAVAGSREQMQGLDEQVQEIKSDVLEIATELDRLEEKLLYPAGTQLAVFVSLAQGEQVRLDSVRIQIDGELVAHHIYSFKELEALQKGGVQRIYTGNVSTGEHRLDVSIAGKRAGGGDLAGSESFAFTKDVEPKLVGITLATQVTGEPRIELGSRQ